MPKSRSIRLSQILLAGLMLGLLLFTTACGGDSRLQQQASQNKAKLDQLIQHAQAIGVPTSVLQPILRQEQQLANSSAPFSLSSDQTANSYYQNLATRYNQLITETQGATITSTEELQAQAQHDMQNFQTALALQRSKKIGNIQAFSLEFSKDQSLLAQAQYPKDYTVISKNARMTTQSLNLLEPTYNQLATFKDTISQMTLAHLDVTAMQSQYQSDVQTFNTATVPFAFQNLSSMLNAQYQQAVVTSISTLPYVSAAQLDQFKTQVDLLQTYGMDATSYQKQLSADQVLMNKARTLQDYLAFSKQIDTDIASMHDDLVQGQANYLVKQFHVEVNAWSNANPFHDSFDGKTYSLDNAYMGPGIGDDLDRELSYASAPSDYQTVIDDVNNALFNLHSFEADYNDKTPYNQIHTTDLQMISHYNLQKGQLLMVSLAEQAMRIYQDGKLVRSFLVTTGRQELPAVPGVWSVLNRESPTTFKSSEPPGSPFWYPDTPIHYAIQYHWGGYFVHDSWWRVNYGPGTQFPHYDTGGDESFAGNGSHGCVNMQEDQAAWVYNNTDWNTQIVIY